MKRNILKSGLQTTGCIRPGLFALIILALSIISCSKDDLDDPDYFIFGDSYGECLGNCANFFLIKDNRIFPDSTVNYYIAPLTFKKIALQKEKYDLAKKVLEDFPRYLSENPDKTFGCPDCHDQGGLHFELCKNGTVKKWHIDTDTDQLPVQIQSYIEEVKSVIQQLK